MTERSEDALKPCDSGMSGETVARAEMVWTNLPTRVPWTSLATHEKALVCHTVAALEAGCTGLVAENALLKRTFLAGHAEGWTGNQQRRDVQHVDAEKSWNLYVENGALNKSRTALRGDREQGEG
jgi:hypothetical protein